MKSNPEISRVKENENPVLARISLLPSPHRGTAGCVTAYKGPLVSDSVLGRPGADDSLCRQQKGRVSPHALACRADGNAGGRTNGKWICGFRSQFKISILILS